MISQAIIFLFAGQIILRHQIQNDERKKSQPYCSPEKDEFCQAMAMSYPKKSRIRITHEYRQKNSPVPYQHSWPRPADERFAGREALHAKRRGRIECGRIPNRSAAFIADCFKSTI